MPLNNLKYQQNIKIFFLLLILIFAQTFNQICNAKLTINNCFISYFVFSPNKKLNEIPADLNLKYEEVWINLPNKNKLYGWYILADKKTDKNIIYCHGTKGNISTYLPGIEQLHKVGANILIVDYEGFGKSTGEALISNTLSDALAMYHFLVDKKNVKPENISLFGYSYGGAVVAELALQRNVHAILLESTFSSLKRIAFLKYTKIASLFIPNSLLDTQKNIKLINVPVIVAYAGNDTVIPVTNSLDLYEEANYPKYLFKINNAEHYNIFKFVTHEYIELIKKVFM